MKFHSECVKNFYVGDLISTIAQFSLCGIQHVLLNTDEMAIVLAVSKTNYILLTPHGVGTVYHGSTADKRYVFKIR